MGKLCRVLVTIVLRFDPAVLSRLMVPSSAPSVAPICSGRLDVGEDGVALISRGSYLYMLERSGKNGITELVLRRMKHTPSLKLHYVFSEPTEVHMHGYSFAHDQRGRFMSTDCGVCIELNMSSARLGWLAVRPIVSESEQRCHFQTLSRRITSISVLHPDCGVCSEK